MKKTNIVPLILLLVMLASIAGAVIFKNWILIFLASEMVIFHLLPPFAVLLSVAAYKTKCPFWFSQAGWENRLYKKLKVKKWKDILPTYNSSQFKTNSKSKEDLIKVMIQSENVHLLLIFLSYVPVFLGKYYGHWVAMILIAFVFSLLHIPFVIVQRFNLPRIINWGA